MAAKLGKNGETLASPKAAYCETLGDTRKRFRNRQQDDVKVSGPGRVAKARQQQHGSSEDTEHNSWIEPAKGSQLHTDGSNDGITLANLFKAAKSKK